MKTFSRIITIFLCVAACIATARDIQTIPAIGEMPVRRISALGVALRRQIVTNPVTSDAWADIIAHADAAVTRITPPPSLNLPLQQARENNHIIRQTARNGLCAALVFSATREEKYGIAALRTLDMFVTHFSPMETQGIANGHGYHTLYAQEWLPDLARTYDIMYEGMRASQRRGTAQWLREMVRVIADERVWSQHRATTHGIWHSVAIGVVGAVVEDAELSRLAERRMQHIFSQLHSEGFWPGGSLRFHYAATRAALTYAYAVRSRSADVYRWSREDGRPYLQAMCEAPLMFIDPLGKIPGNDHLATAPPPADVYMAASVIYRDPLYTTIAEQGRDTVDAVWQVLHYTPSRTRMSHVTPRPSRSVHSRAMGWGVLRSWGASPEETLYARLDYGPHGGVAGHADKLSLYFMGYGRRVTSGGEIYPQTSPMRFGWAKQTLAHNTVVVNYRSQRGASHVADASGIPGELVLFDLDPSIAMMEARAPEAYGEIGLTDYRRSCALTDAYLLDIFTIASETPVTTDWVFHGVGDRLRVTHAVAGERSLNNPIVKRSLLGSADAGYQFIEDVRTYSANVQWHVTWDTGLRTLMMGHPGTRLLTGRSGGTVRQLGDQFVDRETTQNTLIARRSHVLETRYVAVHEIMRNATPKITSFARLDTGHEALVLEIMSAEWRDIFILQPTRDSITFLIDADHEVTTASARYAYVRFGKDGAIRVEKNATIKKLD